MKVVYLHGFASSPNSSKAQFFRRNFETSGVEVAIPDLAQGNFTELTLSSQLAVVDRVVGRDSAVIMGSSMGGYLATLYAARHPNVEKVVALAPAFDFARLWKLRLGEEQFNAWAERGWMETPHYGTGKTERIGFHLYKDALNYEPFPETTQPVLILHGVHDDVVPIGVSRNFANIRNNASLVELHSNHELTDQLDTLWLKTSNFLGISKNA